MESIMALHWKVAGRAGEGIDVTGIMFGKTCVRHGMNVFSYREYPSLIRGGHNTHQVHASHDPVTSQQKHIDVLIALNEEGISLHLDELDKDSIVLCEAGQDGYDVQKYAQTGAQFFDAPMTNISREETGHFLSQNVVSLAMSVWLLGLDIEILRQVVTDQFKEKPKVVEPNLRALQRGYDYAKEHFPVIKPLAEKKPNNNIIVSGNQAVALGAISAGVQYFSAYPMTPASDILHSLASYQDKYPLVVKHAEDEISAINQAIGASYAGVRAMTASATGGYALMVEATSLAAVMETPLVIAVGQRPGPATGLPTWTCQSDLQFIINAGHGECPKIVFTPATAEEHFRVTRQAFYLAEKYHLIVFVLSDKFSLESYMTMPRPDSSYQNTRFGFAKDPLPEDDSYRRFEVTEEGYSPRSIPGQKHGLSITNSYEHDEFGYATEDAKLTKAMNEKRHRKLKAAKPELPLPDVIGPENAKLTLVCWGSTRLVLEHVVRRMPAGDVNVVHFSCVWPFPKETFFHIAQKAEKLIVVEGNAVGQLEMLIRQETGIQAHHHIRRYDGRPFYAEEIVTELEDLIE
jgi:2-oxoglutarate/2-oxoacid ferredoxin oxidoreductase subunit alpha